MRENTSYSKGQGGDDAEIILIRSHRDLWVQVELLIRQLNAENRVLAGVKEQEAREED